MPIYEYICQDCNYTFEKLKSMKDADEQNCPHCQKAVKRLITRCGGFIFKGSGFHATDYKRKNLPCMDNAGMPQCSQGCQAGNACDIN